MAVAEWWLKAMNSYARENHSCIFFMHRLCILLEYRDTILTS
uniref:Uncharacterized protein n=1 Tax=Arundo donax TaxID=35708 RepID=A0A0A9H1Q9_ARUDO